mgnify:CR=1 FL=1
MPSVAMVHDTDPKEALLAKVGDLSEIDVFGNDILVAVYKRPNKTKSGILLADTTLDEDKWQGKAALVLKMGPAAYLDEDGNKFRDIKEGDWVVTRPSDGWSCTLNTLKTGVSRDDAVDCRIVTDISIRMRVQDPDSIY